jgi:transcriptional regulator with XRE-family HTH domain
MPTHSRQQFNAAVESIVERSRHLGVSLTQLCETTGTSRATISRWRNRAPATILSLEKIEQELDRLEAQAKPKRATA